MDIVAIIKELREELVRIDALILALDRIQGGRRRGRPPKLLQQLRARAKPGQIGTRRSAKKAVKKTKKKAAKRSSRQS